MGLPPAVARSLGLAVVLLPAAASLGAISLQFSDKVGAPTSTGAGVGTTFPVYVQLNETVANEKVSALDYGLSASSSGRFQIASRASTSALTPYVSDASLVGVTLSPTTGAPNLGGFAPTSAPDVVGAAVTDLALYQIRVLAGTPNGTYTLSFFKTNYAAASTATVTDNAFASLGTFTVVVPEPTTLAAVASLGGVAMIRRRRAAR